MLFRSAATLYQAFNAAVDKVEAIVTEERIDCHFSRVGKLKVAAKPEHYDKIARSQALLARSVDPELLRVSSMTVPSSRIATRTSSAWYCVFKESQSAILTSAIFSPEKLKKSVTVSVCDAAVPSSRSRSTGVIVGRSKIGRAHV